VIIAYFVIVNLFVIIVMGKELIDSISDDDDDDDDGVASLEKEEVRLRKHGH